MSLTTKYQLVFLIAFSPVWELERKMQKTEGRTEEKLELSLCFALSPIKISFINYSINFRKPL